MVAHAVLLRGAGATSAAPMILSRTDQEFLPAILDELRSDGGVRSIAGSAARVRDTHGTLRLFPPVQRTFHVALLDVACDVPGSPRLDPARIDSAGLVVRRLAKSGTALEGWRQDGRTVRGWVPFSGRAEQELDPDPARRRPALRSGHAEIDRRLTLVRGDGVPLGEAVSPLFVAPPDVCKAAGRTLLYGVVPVASAELSESSAAPEMTAELVRDHLPSYLRAGQATPLPRPGGLVTAIDADFNDDPLFDAFLAMLRQLTFELDAFGESVEGRRVFAALNTIALPHGARTRPAGEAMRDMADVLIYRAPGVAARMPDRWPALNAGAATAIADAARAVLDARAALVAPREGRFGDPTRLYRLRAFARVLPEDGCPLRTVWSADSEPFAIAPWYEPGGAPPVPVQLPDVTDRALLKKLRPTVAFQVPKKLADIVNGDAKKLRDGKAGGAGPNVDWICGFNIPTITICAFIVLSIFLSIFDLIFRWMLFVKICIPVPRRSGTS